jgi:hypothetical protein
MIASAPMRGDLTVGVVASVGHEKSWSTRRCHIGFVFAAVFSCFGGLGVAGGVMQMIAHGLCPSGAMFLLRWRAV